MRRLMLGVLLPVLLVACRDEDTQTVPISGPLFRPLGWCDPATDPTCHHRPLTTYEASVVAASITENVVQEEACINLQGWLSAALDDNRIQVMVTEEWLTGWFHPGDPESTIDIHENVFGYPASELGRTLLHEAAHALDFDDAYAYDIEITCYGGPQ